MKKHFLKSAFFAAMTALMLVSIGCGKENKTEEPKPDEPKPENLAPKFDAAFAAALQSKGVIKDAANITAEEIAGVTKIDVSGTESAKGSLTSLKGIELFKALTELHCRYNNLTSLDLKSNTGLRVLNCSANNLTSLDLKSNTELVNLYCDRNNLTSLDIRSNTKLVNLYCNTNNLKEISVDGLSRLRMLSVADNTALKKIDFSSCTDLIKLSFADCDLGIVDVTKNAALEWIDASCNDLASIDISQNPKLKTLIVDGNPGKGDDYDGIFYVFVPKDFEVNAPPENFTQEGWKYQTRDVNLIYRFKSENLASKFDVAFAKKLVAKGIIKDPEFITAEEIAGVTEINVSGTKSAKGSLTSLKGIEFFKALTELRCEYNNLTNLDLKSNTGLQTLYCSGNNLTSLDLKSNTELVTLWCAANNLKEIKVDGLSKLMKLCFPENTAMKKIDISSCTDLRVLYVDNCDLEHIDVSKNTALEQINARSNDLASIDIRQHPKLKYLYVDGNSGQGDDYDGVFYVYVPKDFDVKAPPANFTQKGWKYQTRDVKLIYYHL